MSDEHDDLVMHYLRRIDGKLDRLIQIPDDFAQTEGACEVAAARHGVLITMAPVRLNHSQPRSDRIGRRLDLLEESRP